MNKIECQTLSVIILVVFITVTFNKMAHAQRHFFIDRPKLELDLSFEYRQDKREGPFTDRNDRSTTFTERFEIATKGWVYHPALLEYSLIFSPEWEQFRKNPSSGSTRTTNTFLSGYEAIFDFLQFKPYSFTLFGLRDTSSIRSNFANKSRVETDTLGVRLNMRHNTFPSSVLYTHRERNQTGAFDTEQEDDEVNMTVQHYHNFSTSTLTGTYKDNSTRTSNSLINENSFATKFYNTLAGNGISLNSGLNYEDTGGSITNTQNYSIREVVNVIHRSNLNTSYELSYEKRDQYDKTLSEDFNTQLKSARFNLTHLLYENLTTSFSTNSNHFSSRTGRESLNNANIGWTYIRSIPWGKLNIDVGYDYSVLDSKVRVGTNSTLLVQDESVTLTSGVITLLTNEFVDTSTIRITQLESFNGFGNIYVKGIDYDIESIGDRTRIIRKLGGNILNGQTVFVQYRYVSRPAFDYSLLTERYGIKFNLWSKWQLFYNLQRSKQNHFDGVIPSGRQLIDDSRHSAGMGYKWKWSETSLEWDDEYTTSTPTETWKAEEIITMNPRYGTYIQISAMHKKFTFKETNISQTIDSISSSIQRLISNRSKLTILGSWMDVSGDTQDYTSSKASLKYEWRYRIWEFNVQYSLFKEIDNHNDETFTNHNVSLALKRNLF